MVDFWFLRISIIVDFITVVVPSIVVWYYLPSFVFPFHNYKG